MASTGSSGALDRAQDSLEFVQVRHEEMAAFMACGHAKFTGEVGVCLATSGPGAIHLLNGLYDAKLDHQPVVAIVGQQARAAIGGNYQQEVDLQSLFKDVAGEYVQTASTAVADPPPDRPRGADRPQRAHGHVRDRPERPAAGGGGRDAAGGARHRPFGTRLQRRRGSCRTTTISRALPRSSTPASASRSWSAPARCMRGAEVTEVAELLGAGVAKALLGKAVLPDELPWVTGSIGLLGTKPSWDLMQECDTLLMVGSSFPYSEFLPRGGAGARRADRHRRPHARDPLSDGGQPRR